MHRVGWGRRCRSGLVDGVDVDGPLLPRDGDLAGIESVMETLRGRAVEFLEYDFGVNGLMVMGPLQGGVVRGQRGQHSS
ncbi:MAG TPA: hypothetical protein VI503_07040 [Gaiellaceae bacterium]|nr:hypothetical protein [Gaiellaceae bacterium]